MSISSIKQIPLNQKVTTKLICILVVKQYLGLVWAEYYSVQTYFVANLPSVILIINHVLGFKGILLTWSKKSVLLLPLNLNA